MTAMLSAEYDLKNSYKYDKIITPTQQGELIGRAAILSEQNEVEAKKKEKAS